MAKIREALALIAKAKRPIFYTGGGIINSGPAASAFLRELVGLTGIPITSTLMGLGAYPASGKHWLGMLGMHGTYEANNAMHGCDLMIAIGARFDDRITGRLDAFSPGSKKIHIDIDPSSINKNVKVDLGIIGDCAHVLEDMVRLWRTEALSTDKNALVAWWRQIEEWRARKSLAFQNSTRKIKPQHAIQRLYELTRDRKTYITTEVGQHQMWAAQHYHFEEPNHWMTSGGLGTMGYGLPAAIGVQLAHRDALVIDIAGEASILMNMQEMSTAAQYRLPVKIFILNNEYMGMVRQWQELLHGGRYSESYSEALPDFVKLAEAYGAHGIRCSDPAKLDDAIKEMIDHPGAVIFDCVVAPVVGLFSGRGYNIESLTVAEVAHAEHLSRITIVTSGTPEAIEQISHQLDRLVPVHRVTDLTLAGKSIERELAMVKVRGKGENRVEAMRLADAFRARVIDASTESFVFELTGRPDKIDQFVELMRPIGLVEVSRTGVAAISRGPEQM